MSAELRSWSALADFLEWLAVEVRRGTVSGIHVATAGSGVTRVSVNFSTTMVKIPPGIAQRDED